MASSTDNAFMTGAGHGPQLDAHHILQHSQPLGPRKISGSSTSTTSEAAMRKKKSVTTRPKANSSASRNTEGSTSTRGENRKDHRDVRTLPRKTRTLPEPQRNADSPDSMDRLLRGRRGSANFKTQAPIAFFAFASACAPASLCSHNPEPPDIPGWIRGYLRRFL